MPAIVRTRVLILVLLVVAAGIVATGADAVPGRGPKQLRILVTNDDGVGAPGIAAVVDALQALPDVAVRVVAPATNQSGTGASFSSTPLTVTPATTASGDAAVAVAGFPADSVLYDVLAAGDDPDLVVSGINAGQNLGNITEISGTVGAARTANRLGIPAIAVSLGIGGSDYGLAARFTASVVAAFRHDFEHGKDPAQTINVNVPSCPTGAVRGVRLVPLGRSGEVTGYTPQSGTVDNGVFAPTVATQNPVAVADCTSTLASVADDIQAFNHGFIPVTVLNPDFGDPHAFLPPHLPEWQKIERTFAAAP
jgi:5'-nucleotidase